LNYFKFNYSKYYRAIFTDSETGEVKKEGDTVVFTKLAETYRRIAAGGPETFYNGSLRDDIVADLEELGDIKYITYLKYRCTKLLSNHILEIRLYILVNGCEI